MNVRGVGGPPTIVDAARQLNVAPEAVSRDFGVVPINPKDGVYAVLVDVEPDHPPDDLFSNPKIEPIGLR